MTRKHQSRPGSCGQWRCHVVQDEAQVGTLRPMPIDSRAAALAIAVASEAGQGKQQPAQQGRSAMTPPRPAAMDGAEPPARLDYSNPGRWPTPYSDFTDFTSIEFRH